MFRRSESVKSIHNPFSQVDKARSKSVSNIFDSEQLSNSELVHQVHMKLLDEILSDGTYQSKLGLDEARTVMQRRIEDLWEKNIAILSFAQNNNSIVFSREAPSPLIKVTGKEVSPINPALSNLVYLSEYGVKNPQASFYNELDVLKDIAFSGAQTTVYIPTNYHTNNKNLHSIRALSNAINYFIGKNNWNVVIVLESDLGLACNINKKNKWLVDNKVVLDGLLKKYNENLRITCHEVLIAQPAYYNAESIFLTYLRNNEKVLGAIKKDVIDHLTPVNSSRVIASALKQSKKSTKQISKEVSFAPDEYDMEKLAKKAMQRILDPNTLEENREKYLIFLGFFKIQHEAILASASLMNDSHDLSNSANLVLQETTVSSRQSVK
jgi:hypothetical protein